MFFLTIISVDIYQQHIAAAAPAPILMFDVETCKMWQLSRQNIHVSLHNDLWQGPEIYFIVSALFTYNTSSSFSL